VVSDLCNFGLGLLQAKHLANGDQWKDSNAEYRETHALTGTMCFPNTVAIGLSDCIQAVQVNRFPSANNGSFPVQKTRPAAEQPKAMHCESPTPSRMCLYWKDLFQQGCTTIGVQVSKQ
jgi:hypothetical protein